MIKVMHVAGARPNFMKVAPVMEALRQYPQVCQYLVHTGQHYDDRLSRTFFEELEIPRPDVNLGVGSGTHAVQTARVMEAFEPVCLEWQPDVVVVVGDVNSTLACALVAAKLGIPVAHVEAGLRSFDWSMPEEINRVVTDRLSDLLFTTEPSANENLRREGVPAERIHFVGNVMIDTLLRHRSRARALRMPDRLGLVPGRFVLVTLHRPSNVDSPEALAPIVAGLERVAAEVPVVFPVHPRTRRTLDAVIAEGGGSSMRLLEPLGYLEFLGLMCDAGVVVTDSGGIQEETTVLGVPCLTVRPNTERPITIEQGTNRLVRAEPGAIAEEALAALGAERRNGRRLPELWDGRAAERIAQILVNRFGG
ncbi:MAG TPA: UDP-N-acetylglucosamine 2-epimerase (non-hydrolyzing) [Longimicrobiales bacterium]